MNIINITTNMWIAVIKDGSALFYGNPNKGLSYHVSDLHWELFERKIVCGTRRWDIMEHIKKWNNECGNDKNWRCKPVKVNITIKEIKKGETND